MPKYMIHTCVERQFYVQRYLVPSMIQQGIQQTDITIWIDGDNQGNLISCMKAFRSIKPTDKFTWHLQDDVLICSTFAAETAALEEKNEYDVVCGYCYNDHKFNLKGEFLGAGNMWFSFPCIRIKDKLAYECSQYFFTEVLNSTDRDQVDVVKSGKNDDLIFKRFLLRKHENVKGLNYSTGLIAHVDYLFGGSIVNSGRTRTLLNAGFTDQQTLNNLLKTVEKKKGERAAVYAGTRNLYDSMVTACKSLLTSCSRIDKVYFLIEDDEFPYWLPPQVQTINVSGQKFFGKGCRNLKSKFTYMTMLRGCLPHIFPFHSKILSLDVDTIVRDSVDELWDIDLTDWYCAMVKEPDRCWGGRFHKRTDPNVYFNAGVTMFNLDKMRGLLSRSIIQILRDDVLTFLDQDALCLKCQPYIYELSNIYNCTNDYEKKHKGYYITGKCDQTAAKIIHYAGISINEWEWYPEVAKWRGVSWKGVNDKDDGIS